MHLNGGGEGSTQCGYKNLIAPLPFPQPFTFILTLFPFLPTAALQKQQPEHFSKKALFWPA